MNDEINYLEVGERIADIRKMNSLTQAQLSEFLNKTINTIQRYENGTLKLPIDDAFKISKKYKVSLDYIYGGALPNVSIEIEAKRYGSAFLIKLFKELSEIITKMAADKQEY